MRSPGSSDALLVGHQPPAAGSLHAGPAHLSRSLELAEQIAHLGVAGVGLLTDRHRVQTVLRVAQDSLKLAAANTATGFRRVARWLPAGLRSLRGRAAGSVFVAAAGVLAGGGVAGSLCPGVALASVATDGEPTAVWLRHGAAGDAELGSEARLAVAVERGASSL